MNFSKIVVSVTALVFLGFGVAIFFGPAAVMGTVHVDVSDPMARTEIRAFYGGLEIGIALFLAHCVFIGGRVRAGLVAGTLMLGGVLAARVLGAWIDGTFHGAILWAAILEGTGTVVNGVAWRMHKGA